MLKYCAGGSINKNESYISGIIGGLIGGLIASIPWILMYVYGNMILSLLAIVIAIGVLKGYQLFKGKIDNKLPIIIIIISVISVTVATFIIIPILLILKEGLEVTSYNFEILYDYQPFVEALIKDYAISLLFTFLGISGVVSEVKKQVSEGTNNIKISINDNQLNNQTEDIETIKKAFYNLNALDKYSAVEKEMILNEINDSNAKKLFNRLKIQQIIIKYKGKYYFSEKNEKSPIRRFFSLYLKILLIVFIIIVIMIGIVVLTDNSNKDDKVDNDIEITSTLINQDNEITYKISNDWIELEEYREDNRWYYVPKIDQSGYSGLISVSYGTTDYEEDDYELFMEDLKASIKESLQMDDIKIDSYKKNKHRVVEVEIEYEDEDIECTENLFYILGSKKYGLVYLTDYHSEEVKSIDQIANDIINSFEWK